MGSFALVLNIKFMVFPTEKGWEKDEIDMSECFSFVVTRLG